MVKSLKTLNGSKIWYSKYGVGKQVGSKIYAHINHIYDIVPREIADKAIEIWIETYNDRPINTFCYDTKRPYRVRFDSCLDFDTAREPSPGEMWWIYPETGDVKRSWTTQVFHHKWLWVLPKYNGFNVRESYEWSKLWLSKVNEVANGYPDMWEKQLEKYGLSGKEN